MRQLQPAMKLQSVLAARMRCAHVTLMVHQKTLQRPTGSPLRFLVRRINVKSRGCLGAC